MEIQTDEYGGTIINPSPEPQANECWQYVVDNWPKLARGIRETVQAIQASKRAEDPRPLYLRDLLGFGLASLFIVRLSDLVFYVEAFTVRM